MNAINEIWDSVESGASSEVEGSVSSEYENHSRFYRESPGYETAVRHNPVNFILQYVKVNTLIFLSKFKEMQYRGYLSSFVISVLIKGSYLLIVCN